MSGAGSCVLRDVDVLVVGDCDGGSVGVHAVAVPKLGVDVIVEDCFALFDLLDEQVVVLDFEEIGCRLLVGEEVVVLLRVRVGQLQRRLCRHRGDRDEESDEEGMKFDEFHCLRLIVVSRQEERIYCGLWV